MADSFLCVHIRRRTGYFLPVACIWILIRTGNGTSYSRITAVAPGTKLEYVASAFNGWHAVKIGSQVGWVSGEYSEITSE